MTLKAGAVRCRMAPSPTGPLNFGTARTTLINWLFARHNKGVFVMRVEDTDMERSKHEFEDDLITGLKWLGIEWDEGPDIGGPYGPYRQSERLDLYEQYLKKMLDEAQAYYCYCTKEELEIERQVMMKKGEASRYSGRCRTKPPKGRESQVIRFKTPEKKISFNDIIRGEITFDLAFAGDIVIAKDLRNPLYNFAVVIDDYEMKISHVIRGEDHIANTPKQILIQRALNFSTPQYAHLPLILDPDRSKMSKRHSATSIEEYQKQGYLPETLVNFMALLGWHPSDNKEKMSLPEIIQCFDIEKIQKGGAIFDVQKLDWLNSQYIKKYDNEALLKLIKQLPDFEIAANDSQLLKIINYGKERAATLKNFQAIADSYTRLNDYKSEMLLWKNTGAKNTKENLRKTKEILFVILEREFNKSGSEKYLMPLADSQGRGEVLWPLRVALTGRDKSPGPFEIIDVLGKEESLKRINMAIEKLSNLII